ncbi:Histone-lysine N-methyltransferase setd1b [Homalodisca vitripennis]|nr:Histone-lysine N-methyltransferase setd1b [Homalodisca vitripennis]
MNGTTMEQQHHHHHHHHQSKHRSHHGHHGSHHHHHHHSSSSSSTSSHHHHTKPRNYKMLVDPFLVKGSTKLYRYDGTIPNDPTYPPVQVRDPRSQLTRIWTRLEPLDLPVPRFKIDGNYVGEPPPLEVTIFNLNDNIDKSFLAEKVQKAGTVEDLYIYYHPLTNKHLGLAHIVFEDIKSARACIDRLNNTSVMGKLLKVFLDPFGEECQKKFTEMTTEKKIEKETTSNTEIKSEDNSSKSKTSKDREDNPKTKQTSTANVKPPSDKEKSLEEKEDRPSQNSDYRNYNRVREFSTPSSASTDSSYVTGSSETSSFCTSKTDRSYSTPGFSSGTPSPFDTTSFPQYNHVQPASAMSFPIPPPAPPLSHLPPPANHLSLAHSRHPIPNMPHTNLPMPFRLPTPHTLPPPNCPPPNCPPPNCPPPNCPPPNCPPPNCPPPNCPPPSCLPPNLPPPNCPPPNHHPPPPPPPPPNHHLSGHHAVMNHPRPHWNNWSDGVGRPAMPSLQNHRWDSPDKSMPLHQSMVGLPLPKTTPTWAPVTMSQHHLEQKAPASNPQQLSPCLPPGVPGQSSQNLDLDTRIEMLLKDRTTGGMNPPFLRIMSDSGGSDDESRKSPSKRKRKLDDERVGVKRLCGGDPLYSSDNAPTQPKEKVAIESVEVPRSPLSQPPSPFISEEVYLHWYRKGIEQTRQAKIQEIGLLSNVAKVLTKDDLIHSEISSSEDEILTRKSPSPNKNWQEDNVDHKSTPLQDEMDDRMSLSSLSSGDEKIESLPTPYQQHHPPLSTHLPTTHQLLPPLHPVHRPPPPMPPMSTPPPRMFPNVPPPPIPNTPYPPYHTNNFHPSHYPQMQGHHQQHPPYQPPNYNQHPAQFWQRPPMHSGNMYPMYNMPPYPQFHGRSVPVNRPQYPMRPLNAVVPNPNNFQNIPPGVPRPPVVRLPPPSNPLMPLIKDVVNGIIKELKQILKRDFNRKMVENTAFKSFEHWWDEQKLLEQVLMGVTLYYSQFFHFCPSLSTTSTALNFDPKPPMAPCFPWLHPMNSVAATAAANETLKTSTASAGGGEQLLNAVSVQWSAVCVVASLLVSNDNSFLKG